MPAAGDPDIAAPVPAPVPADPDEARGRRDGDHLLLERRGSDVGDHIPALGVVDFVVGRRIDVAP
jgi:hypothetical protein